MNRRVIVSVLVKKGNEYLFIRQNKPGGAYPDALHIPGGGLEPGADPVSAIKRELKEETNITATNVKAYDFDYDITEYKGSPTQLVFLRFTADYSSGEPRPGSDAKEILWVSERDLGKYRHNPPSQRLLAKLGLLPDG